MHLAYAENEYELFISMLISVMEDYVCVCEEAVVGMILPNHYLFHYFIWECCVGFMPAFSEIQPGCETKATCLYVRQNALRFSDVLEFLHVVLSPMVF
jgi:hypothetical protein